jgi:hypothetical protein
MEFVGVEDKQYNTKLILCTYGERQLQTDVRNYGSNIFGRLKYVFCLVNGFLKKKNQTLTLVFTILNRKYIRIKYRKRIASKPGGIRSVHFLLLCHIIPGCY